MNSRSGKIWLLPPLSALAAVTILIAAGCDPTTTKSTIEQAARAPGSKEIVAASKDAALPSELSLAAELTSEPLGGSRYPIVDDSKETLSPAEQREFEELKLWCKGARGRGWGWEYNPAFKRFRPVGLMVLGSDRRLTLLLPSSLHACKGALMCNWDMKCMLQLTGDSKFDLENLRTIRKRTEEINQLVEERRAAVGEAAPFGAVPLRRLQPPRLYETVEDLDDGIQEWLAVNFVESRSSGNQSDALSDSRPPFGTIWFEGHGQSVEDAASGQFLPQFGVRADKWFDLSGLEKEIVRKYQAPVDLNLDLCRQDEEGETDQPNEDHSELRSLIAKDFDNWRDFDNETQIFIRTLETYRSGLTADYFAGIGDGVTKLVPDRNRVKVYERENSLLTPAAGYLLEQAASATVPNRLVFKNVPGEPTALTLEDQRRLTWQFFKNRGNKRQEPHIIPGSISHQVVRYSTNAKMYQPHYFNLLGGGVSRVTHFPKSFNVPGVVDSDPTFNRTVTVVREQETYDDGFKFGFEFAEPFELQPETNYQLVLVVTGEGKAPEDTITFTTGVYGKDSRETLNSKFSSNYDIAEGSTNSPVLCDGSVRVIHIPLDQVNDDEPVQVAWFEVQATPHAIDAVVEKRWKKDSALTIHGVYLVPDYVTDADLNSEIERVRAAPTLLSMCSWMLPLHNQPDAVPVPNSGEDVIIRQTLTDHMKLWGVAGNIYPKVYVRPESRHIRLKIKADAEVDESARVFLGVYSETSVLAARNMLLKGNTDKDISIPLMRSGLAEEVVIAVEGYAGDIEVVELDFQKRSADKE